MEKIPLHSIVVTIGTTHSGKTSWCEREFSPWEILSVDQVRQELTGTRANYTQDRQVWSELHRRARLRLEMGQRVVIDAPNLKKQDREPFVNLAVDLGVPVFYVLLDRPMADKKRGSDVNHYLLNKQQQTLAVEQRHIHAGDGRKVTVIKNQEQATVVCTDTGNNNTRLLVVGDVHGDYLAMTQAVEYAKNHGLFIVWLGDVIDYGSQNLKCMKLAYQSVAQNQGHMIWGNHERKIDRWIHSDYGAHYSGRLSDANLCTIREIESLNLVRRTRFLAAWRALANWSTQHLKVGNWLFTHGAASPEMWDAVGHRLPGDLGNMAYFGEVDSRDPTRQDGYPNRIWNWVNSVPAGKTVVVGHDWLDRQTCKPVIKTNNQGGAVIALDTGNSKGGVLSALDLDVTTNQYKILKFTG
jgi:protein phosphatase